MEEKYSFNKFVLKLSLFISTVILLLVFLFFTGQKIYHLDTNEYLFALLDKNKNLEKKDEKDRKRIIFVGGSNLAFGLDSKKIETKFNRKVLNMGLHAGLGLKFMINDIKDKLIDGDIVILVPEYQHFFGEDFEGGQIVSDILYFAYNEGFNKLDFKQIIVQIKFIPKSIKSSLYNAIKDKYKTRELINKSVVYQRNNFNEYGDMIGHLEKKNVEIEDESLIEKILNKNAIEFINNFSINMAKKNVDVFFLYPVYIDYSYEKSKTQIEELKNELINKLKVKKISNPERYKLSKEYFYDTSYHLNKKGRDLRTKMVIQDIFDKVLNKGI